MPHIVLDGCHIEKIITQISISVDVTFRNDYFKEYRRDGWQSKMNELEEKLGAVISEYFPDYSSEQLSNHEWNTKMKYYD